MTLTARFAHLESMPRFRIGELVNRGDVIGRMGNSGQSSGAHLHLDVVEGEQDSIYSLVGIEAGVPKCAPLRQLLYFIDSELFGVEPVITTHFCDPEYFQAFKKVHMGFDLVPEDRHQTKDHFNIHWNRSAKGRVTRIGYDEHGYGYHILIAFEV
jgi:hypothetical protein